MNMQMRKAAVSRCTTSAHQSEAAICTRHPEVGDVAGNAITISFQTPSALLRPDVEVNVKTSNGGANLSANIILSQLHQMGIGRLLDFG